MSPLPIAVASIDRVPSIFDVKRLIGRIFSDPEVQSDIKYFPFKVIDKDGKPHIKVQYCGEDKEFVGFVVSQPASIAVLTLP